MVEQAGELRERTRESIGEHERRIAHVMGLRKKELTHRAPVRPRTLLDALESRAFISREELRELAHPYEAPATTLYMNFTPLRPDVSRSSLSIFRSLRHQELVARRAFVDSLGRYPRFRLDRDLEEIEAFLQDFTPKQARSLVIFKSGEELNRVVTLTVRTIERMSIDSDPYVEPLEAVLNEQNRALVVQLSREEAHLLTYQLGHREEVDSVTSRVPAEAHHAARPGKDQRHRLTHLHWHLRAVESVAARAVDAHDCDVVILAGDEPILTAFREMMRSQLSRMLIGSFHPDPHETRRLWHEYVEAILGRWREEQEAAALSELPAYAARGLVARGLRAVLDVMNIFLVRSLYLNDDVVKPGHVCRDHHYLSLEAGRCPYCDREMLDVENVVDELVEMALRQNVELVTIRRRRDLLEPYGGLAALTYSSEAAAD